MFCIKCGKELANNDKFCSYCGRAVVSVVDEEKLVNKFFDEKESRERRKYLNRFINIIKSKKIASLFLFLLFGLFYLISFDDISKAFFGFFSFLFGWFFIIIYCFEAAFILKKNIYLAILAAMFFHVFALAYYCLLKRKEVEREK